MFRDFLDETMDGALLAVPCLASRIYLLDFERRGESLTYGDQHRAGGHELARRQHQRA